MVTSADLDATTVAERLLAAVEQSGLSRSDDPVALAAALDLAVRAAEVLILHRLAPFAASYPATVQALLTVPESQLEVSRDAGLDPADFLGWRDLLDLLCAESISCIAPRLHRGWQDKAQSCRQARRVTRGAVGFAIDAAVARPLLASLAIRNRVFLAPPPTRLEAAEVRSAITAVLEIVEKVATEEAAGRITEVSERLRGQAEG